MKSNLLVFPYFYPAYKSGGPVRSAVNLIKVLGKKYNFKVFTSDRDLGDTEPFQNVNVGSWDNKYLDAEVFYSSKNTSFLKLIKIFKNEIFNSVYLNSFFDYKFSIRFLFLLSLGFLKCEKVILAPRGELTFGAMSLKSSKKKLYIKLFRYLGLKRRIVFHFTSMEELEQSKKYLGDIDAIVVPNMHSSYPDFYSKYKDVGSLNMVFLSRISPKKNLHLVIEALRKITDGNIDFTIVGAIDDPKYWADCQRKINDLSDNVKVNYVGAIEHSQISKVLLKSHLFILPTLNENYGHAIVEAMVYSNLVLISDQTPWSQVSYSGSYVINCYDEIACFEKINEAIYLDQMEFNLRAKKTYDFCDSILKNNVNLIYNMFE